MSLVFLHTLSGKTSGRREGESLCKHQSGYYITVSSHLKIFHLRGKFLRTQDDKKNEEEQAILRMSETSHTAWRIIKVEINNFRKSLKLDIIVSSLPPKCTGCQKC